LVQGYYAAVIKELRQLFPISCERQGIPREVDRRRGAMIVPRNLDNRHTANGILKEAGSKARL
jgi:hypothetical protein